MPARAFRDKADFASTSWRFLNRIQAGRPTRAGAHCAPLRRETHPIRPGGRQAAAGGPPNGSPAQRVPFGEEKQGSGRGMPARAFRDKADFASTSWPFSSWTKNEPPQAAPNGSPAQRVPFGEEKQGSGRGMPPRAFRGKADFASTSWRFLNQIQAGRPTRAGAHCAPLRRETHPIRPAGDKPPQAGSQTPAQRSGCRLERRSKGAGEECPPGRSEIKRTLLRRHGGSRTGYR